MSFKEIQSEIKPSYNSANSDIVNDFYNKVLSEAIRYDRISGFFNSTSLAIAARGMDKFVKNNGHMRLLCGAQLDEEDLKSINNADDLKDIIDKKFLRDYSSIEDELLKNHVKVLGWMVANGYLEIKIGINKKSDGSYSNGMLHSKIGIMYDEFGDSLLFNGSVNETAYGWRNNIESLKVFYSWKNPEYMEDDKKDFETFWKGLDPSLSVFDVPEATKNKLIEIAPKTKKELENLKLSNKPKLREYQNDALKCWLDNDMKGIFAMATGTGKTFTALSCFDNLLNKKSQLMTVIVCPQKHLISQWEKNLETFDYKGEVLHAYGDNSNWSSEFLGYIGDLESGLKRQLVVFTTFDTFSRDRFIDKIDFYDGEILLIVDEVHGIGSTDYRNGLLPHKYDYRLGLSATPEIEDDFERTDLVNDYFGGIVYTYDLEKAINNGFLTHYNYYPQFIDLDSDELECYMYYTHKMSMFVGKKKLSEKEERTLRKYQRKRRNIINNANAKMVFLKNFLKNHRDIKDLIIYCTGDQKKEILEYLDELAISNHKFTGEESTKKVRGESERDRILRLFANGYYQVLVGIKCLDEGVDVPSTQTAILMASTLNSRQHIQRRGRVLRKSPGKEIANIYDLVVFPNIKNEPDSIKRIVRNEQKRYDEYADLADNYVECSKLFIEKWEENK